jgi:hypothetical protein
MQTETSTSCASRRCPPLRYGLGVLFLLCAVPRSSVAANVLEPKQPEAKTTKVRIKHTHRTVRECRYEASTPESRCVASLTSADPRTKLQLWPIRDGSLEARNDSRKPVDVVLGSGGESSQAIADVAAGRWEVAWLAQPGHDQFEAKPPTTVEVALETVTGACELNRSGCKLVRGIKRRVRIAHP